MTGKIFRNSMLVGLSVFLLSAGLFLGVLYHYFENRLLQELYDATELVAQGVERLGASYLEQLNSHNRITWVDGQGVVWYDSAADHTVMENHRDREEIQQALQTGQGMAERYSNTLAEKTLYVAQRLEDGSVIRLASAQNSMAALLYSMLKPIVLILLVSMMVAMVLADRLCRKLVKPILELDLEHPETCETYEELTPLLTRLRKQAQTIRAQMSTLRQQQREFTALTDNMSEGFLLLDQKGHILSYNSGALRLLGAVPPPEGANLLALERSERFLWVAEQALAGQRQQGNLERGGRCIQILADPVLRENEAAGAVLLLMDVTERARSEQLRREFSANVSHELKTPLTAISGMAEIMRNGLVKPEDMCGFAGDIYQESQRLITLIEDIIHLSRLDEGGAELERTWVELLPLVETVLRRLRPLAQSNQITLNLEGPDFSVFGVPAVLTEIIYNLCENAIKYNRPGGQVLVFLEATGRIRVSDTGIGIPDGDQERVFERFYRVDKSHSKEIGGTGLGLSIVKHGAALHNASLALRSTLGKGTEITLCFSPDSMRNPDGAG